MNSVAPIASNRVYVREKYFNCSNFICKERSQWRLESWRSLFFPVFVRLVFCCCRCCFSINYNYFPLPCFTLLSLLTLYASRDFSDYVFLVINTNSILRNSLVKFRVFWVAPLNVSPVGLFFPLCILSGFIWERGNKVESNGPRLHLDVTNWWRQCDYRPDRYTSLVLCFSTPRNVLSF